MSCMQVNESSRRCICSNEVKEYACSGDCMVVRVNVCLATSVLQPSMGCHSSAGAAQNTSVNTFPGGDGLVSPVRLFR